MNLEWDYDAYIGFVLNLFYKVPMRVSREMIEVIEKRLFKFTTSLCATLILVLCSFGCVGTVEDKNPDTSKTSAGTKVPASFVGIDRAIAIAEDKVEVYFFPANGGANAADFVYLISYDGLANPITVSGAFLAPDYRGLLSHTVTGLTSDTSYTFDVQVKNISDIGSLTSSSKETSPTKTFKNITSDFAGIAVAQNIGGAEGMTSVRTEWPEAYHGNPLLPPIEKDVVEYELVLVNSNAGSPADFDNTTLSTSDRKVFTVSSKTVSYIANGLSPDTEYYVRVRATHYGATQNSFDSSYLKEQNNKYRVIKTLSADLSAIEYDPSETSIERAAGAAGKSSLEITWGDVIGAFDHFRIYYTITGDLLNQGVENSYIMSDCDPLTVYGAAYRCKKVELTLFATSLTDLVSQSDYKVKVFICQTSSCADGERLRFDQLEGDTKPPLATFFGVTSFSPAKDANAIDRIYLNMDSPDFTAGTLDGIAVKVLQNPALGINQDYYLNLPDLDGDGDFDDDVLNLPAGTTAEAGSGLTVVDFDFKNDTEVAVSGIDPFTNEIYSFLLIPYIFNTGKIELFEGTLPSANIIPSILTPSASDFPGVSSYSCDIATQSIRVRWNDPIKGVFSNFAVFWTNLGTFDFGTAKSNVAGYNGVLTSASASEYTIPYLAAGSYLFGVLSFASLGDGYYSENNSNVFLISIPGDCN